VLWRVNHRALSSSSASADVTAYNSFEGIFHSDHKPVYARFRLKVSEDNRPRKEAVAKEEFRNFLGLQHARVPQLELCPAYFYEMLTGYTDQEFHWYLELKNNGGGEEETTFRVENRTVPSWITFTPLEGAVRPGGSSMLAIQTAPLTKELFEEFGSRNHLRCVVVIRVHGGDDVVLPISIENRGALKVTFTQRLRESVAHPVDLTKRESTVVKSEGLII